MSAIEISKQPGMPSAPAFIRKRRTDPVFRACAEAILRTRRLNNSGRPRVTADRVDRFLLRLKEVGPRVAMGESGAPSMAWVQKRRLRDEGFAERLSAARFLFRKLYCERTGHQGFGGRPACTPAQRAAKRKAEGKVSRFNVAQVPLRERLHGNELYAAVAAAVPRRLLAYDRDDVIADVVAGVLDGSFRLDDLAAAVKQSIKQHNRLFGGYGTVSIDRPLFPGSDLTIGDRLVSPEVHPYAD
ncbi:hypothetical protein [Reyranella sp.]|nr:hypothetical protein [Reyranella sp.]HQS15054.1 hypothetical protein [Reyranella sp.]HQT10863.1 hypothetical protein [Reyranella sp.]